jgi:hypothetical protein
VEKDWGQERKLYVPADVVNRLGITDAALRRFSAEYERVHGPLPRDEGEQVWSEEAVERLESARAAVLDGSAVSVEQALRASVSGAIAKEGPKPRPGGLVRALRGESGVQKQLLEELRLLRHAVEGINHRMTALERESRHQRDTVVGFANDERKAGQEFHVGAPEASRPIRDWLLSPRDETAYAHRTTYEMLPWYVIGCVLVWAAAAFGSYDAQSNGVSWGPIIDSTTAVVSLRGIVAFGFGVYAGIRDGRQLKFPMFIAIGFIVGLGAAAATAIVSYWIFGHTPGIIFSSDRLITMITKLVSTWVLFVSGALLGKVLKDWASAEGRVDTQRLSVILVFAGTVISALIGLIGSLLTG